jgi:hypothetical protein
MPGSGASRDDTAVHQETRGLTFHDHSVRSRFAIRARLSKLRHRETSRQAGNQTVGFCEIRSNGSGQSEFRCLHQTET